MNVWVVDIHRHLRFGPFKTKREAQDVRKTVRQIPDDGLQHREKQSNVFVVRESEPLWTSFSCDTSPGVTYTDDFSAFPIGNLAKVEKQNEQAAKFKASGYNMRHAPRMPDPYYSYSKADQDRLFKSK